MLGSMSNGFGKSGMGCGGTIEWKWDGFMFVIL